MIDAELLQALQVYFDKQQLVKRAIDAAADAFRAWYNGQPSARNIDSVGLYPRFFAVDLTIPTNPLVITKLTIGLPDPDGVWLMDVIPLGTLLWRTTLDGQYNDEQLIIREEDLCDLYDEAYPTTLPLPTYPLKDHGSALNSVLHEPQPDTIIPTSISDQLIASHDWAACKAAAYSSGLEAIANCFSEYPEHYGSWTPATMTLADPQIWLIFRIDYEYPIFIKVDLDVMSIPPFDSSEKPRIIGNYYYSTLLDGTVNDDGYALNPDLHGWRVNWIRT